MKNRLLKLNAVLLLGLCFTPLQSQTTMNVLAKSGAQTPYSLSSIRKLTFPSAGNMTVTKNSAVADNYVLSDVRKMNFNDVGTSNESDAMLMGEFKLYPNPVQDVLNIHFSATQKQLVTVELLSIEGKILIKSQFTDKVGTLNVSAFHQGVYICRINNGEKIEITKFFKK